MNTRTIYAGLAFSLLLEMVCILFFATTLSVGLVAYCLFALQMTIFIVIGISTTLMDKSLKRNVNAINQLNQKITLQATELAMLTHDIRSPLSGICQMARLIYTRLDDQELKRLQKLIIESSEQLAKRLETASKEYDVNDIVR